MFSIYGVRIPYFSKMVTSKTSTVPQIITLIMYHNLIKQNPSFYAKSYPYIMYVLLTILFLSLTHAVKNVRYSVNYSTISTTGKYVP